MNKEIKEYYFFNKLKSERKTKNLSVNDVVEGIKINKKYVEAIENGNFNLLPKTYARLFIKSYAKFIGADTTKTLEEIFTLSNKCAYLNIAMYLASQILPNGENAHCTLKPKQWWKYRIAETIKEHIEVHVVYSYTHGIKNIEYEIYTKT